VQVDNGASGDEGQGGLAHGMRLFRVTTAFVQVQVELELQLEVQLELSGRVCCAPVPWRSTANLSDVAFTPYFVRHF
jgi:hypothetical protein